MNAPPKIPAVKLVWALLLLAFVLAQAVKLSEMAPPVEMGGDAVTKWFLARDIGEANPDTFWARSHHHLRWGSWAPASTLVALFSDRVTYYFLATAIPSIVAGALLTFFVLNSFGIFCAAFFAVLWWFDLELYRATFQLMPTGAGLLPLALLVFSVVAYLNSSKARWPHVLAIFLASFWLYGVKETNLFFVPGIVFIFFIKKDMRALALYFLLWVGGYAVETLAFHALSHTTPALGRIQALLDDGRHLRIMFEYKPVLQEQAAYFDSGITIRLYRAHRMQTVLYFAAVLISILFLSDWQRQSEYGRRWNPLLAVSLLFLSYMIFTLLFVISVTPIRLGQALVPRYLAIAIPLGFIVILGFAANYARGKSRYWIIPFVFILPFYLAPSVNRYIEVWRGGASIGQRADCYRKFAARLDGTTCVRTRNDSRVERKLLRQELLTIPRQYRSERIERLIAADIEAADGGLRKKLGEDCAKPVIIPPICPQ